MKRTSVWVLGTLGLIAVGCLDSPTDYGPQSGSAGTAGSAAGAGGDAGSAGAAGEAEAGALVGAGAPGIQLSCVALGTCEDGGAAGASDAAGAAGATDAAGAAGASN